ncbi:hypothetical protein PybrP1_004725, partial [[Pythium] brassicae (nom. inval.)]
TMMTTNSMAERLWQQAQACALQSLYHPFVASLAAGSLARADFQAFLLQDAYYLQGFAKAFAFAVAKATDPSHARALIRLMVGIETELSTHTAFLQSFGIDVFAIEDASAAPATRDYVDFLLETATTRRTVAEVLAAMTPCLRLYAFLGRGIRAAIGGLPDESHPYSRWIASYCTDEFGGSARAIEDLLGETAALEGVSYATLEPLYNAAMELELRFFEQYFPLARAHSECAFPSVAFPVKVLLSVPGDETTRVAQADVGQSLTLVVGLAATDVVLSLGKGEYEIHVARGDDEKIELTVHALATEGDGAEKRTSEHPLLRALVGGGSAFVSGFTAHYDADVHAVATRSTLELVTFLRLVSAGGSFQEYAGPLVFTAGEAAGREAGRVPPRVLIIAGSDSGGGAGVQADMKACTNLGVFSSSAITAVTVQNTLGVHSIHALPVNAIADQITCVLDDIGADVVKTGMLFNDEIIAMVATVLKARGLPLVVDPVMVATSGDRLLTEAAHKSLVAALFPLATLHGRAIETLEDMKAAAKDLAAFGSAFVLVKGGHLPASPSGDVHDVLYDAARAQFHVMSNRKLSTKNTHGTGCTLASAIAAEVAKTGDMVGAVRRAVAYLHRVLAQSQHLAIGQGDSRPMLHVM